jgi:hypothetical protein
MAAQASIQAQAFPRFAEPKEAFGVSRLRKLVKGAKEFNDLRIAKQYLCSYFISCSNPHGVFMWRPDIKNLEHIPDKNITKLIRPISKKFYIQTSQDAPVEKKEFNIYGWFMSNYNSVCMATCDPIKPCLFKVKGQLYLNIFPGFPHALQPLTTFDNKVHLAVKLIFMHI